MKSLRLSKEEGLGKQKDSQSKLSAYLRDNAKKCLLLIMSLFAIGVSHGQNYEGEKIGSQLRQDEIRSMVKDSTIDADFIPYDQLPVIGNQYDFRKVPKGKSVNLVGLKFYFQSPSEEALYCDPQTSKVYFKRLEVGNYEITEIIATAELARMYYQNFAVNESFEGEQVPSTLREKVASMFDGRAIYVITNENGEQFYSTTLGTITVSTPNRYQELAGKQVAIFSEQSNFTDVMTGEKMQNMNPNVREPFKSNTPLVGYDFEGIINARYNPSAYKDKLTYSFPELNYCICTKVLIEEGRVYGVFEYEGTTFALILMGKTQDEIRYNGKVITTLEQYHGGSGVSLMTQDAIERVQNDYLAFAKPKTTFKEIWKEATADFKGKKAKEKEA